MGIHIHLKTEGGEYHPDWDSVRYAVDREFSQCIDWHDVDWKDDDYADWRPKDIDRMRVRIAQFDGWSVEPKDSIFAIKRFWHLCDLLEANPEYYVCIN